MSEHVNQLLRHPSFSWLQWEAALHTRDGLEKSIKVGPCSLAGSLDQENPQEFQFVWKD